jgi:hypothetical protein
VNLCVCIHTYTHIHLYAMCSTAASPGYRLNSLQESVCTHVCVYLFLISIQVRYTHTHTHTHTHMLVTTLLTQHYTCSGLVYSSGHYFHRNSCFDYSGIVVFGKQEVHADNRTSRYTHDPYTPTYIHACTHARTKRMPFLTIFSRSDCVNGSSRLHHASLLPVQSQCARVDGSIKLSLNHFSPCI